MNTSGPPQEVFKKIEDIFHRRLPLNDEGLKPIPEADPRSGDNTKEPIERLPQSIVDTTPNVDPILNNHDLLKSEFQSSNTQSNEVKLIVSHGDSSVADKNQEQESDVVEISNQSSEILYEDGASKSSSTFNNSIKEENNELAEQINKVPDVREEDITDSLYS